ncbi:MAG: zinc ribbon domain-containing protein [Phycisphaerales bacterium]|nr:MAG: zinc ribbon domain-containing protein [Phycisphaerales bacterium]
MIDEGPSPEDLERFEQGEAYCPHCGKEVFDDADICPHCGDYITGSTMRHPPHEQQFRRRWITLVVIVLILLLAGVYSLARILGW